VRCILFELTVHLNKPIIIRSHKSILMHSLHGRNARKLLDEQVDLKRARCIDINRSAGLVVVVVVVFIRSCGHKTS